MSFWGIAADATTLIRQEVLLARLEVSEGLMTAAKASAFLVVADAWAIGGPIWLGFAIVTAVQLIITAVLAWWARSGWRRPSGPGRADQDHGDAEGGDQVDEIAARQPGKLSWRGSR